MDLPRGMDMGQVIIGCGTGRCGTVNLAYLLRQNGVWATHEMRPLLPWKVDHKLLQERIAYFRSSPKPVADVAFFYLPYLPYLFAAFPDMRVVVLKRDRASTVDSLERKVGKRNHWMDHDGESWKLDPIWDPCFPKFSAKTRREAIGKYWDFYYREAEKLVRKYPGQVGIFPIEVFNSSVKMRELLEFCGVKPAWIPPQLKLNQGREGHRDITGLQVPPGQGVCIITAEGEDG